jgi:putative membrane protein
MPNSISHSAKLAPSMKKNDAVAKWLIGIFSAIVFTTVIILGRYNLVGKVKLPFDVHLFALANAIINAIVAMLLLAGAYTVRKKMYVVHKRIMITAMLLSVLFLLSYICHHLFAGETLYGETDGIKGLSDEELAAADLRTEYLILLATHIPLAGLGLPFILLAAYRALVGEYEKHKKIVRVIWPIWFYVAVTGVIVYIMISPYYV